MKAHKLDLFLQRKPVPASRRRDKTVRFLRLRSAEVRLREVGSGPVLVTCPDPPNVIEHQAPILERLSAFARVICYEQPGFGLSRAGKGFDFSTKHYADTLIDLLETMGLRDVVLALPCVSGFFAIDVAYRRPDLVAKVVLIQTPCLADQHRWLRGVSARGLLTTPFVGQLLVRAIPVVSARAWYAKATSRHEELGLLATNIAARRGGAGNGMASALQAFTRLVDPGWGALPQPGLIIWGKGDLTHRETDPKSCHSYLPDARLVELATGHFPELEDPTTVSELVRDFILPQPASVPDHSRDRTRLHPPSMKHGAATE